MKLKIVLAAVLMSALTGLTVTANYSVGLAKARPSPTGTPSPTPSPTGSPVPPPPGWASEKLFGSGDDWEPAIAVDPSSNYVYQVTTRYGGAKACTNKGATACPSPNLVYRVSSDGGVTWGSEKFLCPCQGTTAQNDPEIDVANNGTIYAAWLNDYTPGVVFSKSSDHGNTWTAPIPVGGGLQWTDKPMLTVSPSGQDVYIAFNKTASYVVASHNGGASFSAPVKTNSDKLYWFAEGGAVAPNGNVYFSESGEVDSVSAAGDVQLAVLRSTDGGASWTHNMIDTSKQGPACTSTSCAADFLFPQASVAIDSAGKLMAVYTLSSTAGAPKGLYFRTSTDGLNWSARTQINGLGDSGFPVVTAGPTAGDFRIAWMDDRAQAGGRYNTYYRRTTNGGGTWSSEVVLSNQGSGAGYKTAAGFASPYGDYFEIDTNSAGKNFVIWGEGKSYLGPGGSWFTSGS